MIRIIFVYVLLSFPLLGQTRNVAETYSEMCASCHGTNLEGGSAPSLLTTDSIQTTDELSLVRTILEGRIEQGMPSFAATLDNAEARALIVYLRETHARARHQPAHSVEHDATLYQSREHQFRTETITEGLNEPWSICWLPDGRILVTEKSGTLRMISEGMLDPKPISGIPDVYNGGQGGLLEIAPHPDYAKNGWLYLAYSDPVKDSLGRVASMTKIVRGKIRDRQWVEEETIWQAPSETYLRGRVHFGCRIAFDQDNYLFFTQGDRGRQNMAQDLAPPNGKIYRLHDDGRIPQDNPFVNHPDALPSIWSYGHRNPQGLAFEPNTGQLWSTEHGPRGGDELNLILSARNYGWPVITYGINYNGTPITELTAKDGLEQPVVYWTPSPAVCGIDFYTGTKFPKWEGNLFVTALAGQHLRRVVIVNSKVTEQEVLLQDIGRVRDVATGPDGALYLLLNRPGKIIRLVTNN
jgi:glucose/arabinose dehydrogenase